MPSSSNQKAPTDGVLIAWYGDDFTGAAAVMEVLEFAGLPSMLFVEPPTQTQLDRYPELRGIGIASTARAESPAWMDAELPLVFESLRKLNPALVHYKICSTLDSSPETGSIGRAIEIAADKFSPTAVPILVAAPQMRRYQCFGHLFAGVGDTVVRLDRHPVMSRHPVTPMHESDVARHIEKQSDRLTVGLMSLEGLASERASLELELSDTADKIAAITIDCIDARSESIVGSLIWQGRDANPFVVGSQGVEYALIRHWLEAGQLIEVEPPGTIGSANKMIAVSGSVSPTTAEQIAWSLDHGFEGIVFDAVKVCTGDLEAEIERVVDASLAALASGKDPIVYSASGPDDPNVGLFNQAVAASKREPSEANQMIGHALGRVLHRVLERSDVKRAVVSGGDTSGYALRQMDIFALSALAPTIPGAAIFKAHSSGATDGLELALKGGQMGSPDYFGWIKEGGGSR